VYGGLPLVFPTDDFFPEHYDYTQDAARVLMRRVCTYIGVSYESVILRVTKNSRRTWFVNHAGQYLPHAAGTFEAARGKYIITIDADELATPKNLIGTFAHEMVHARLLGERRLNSRAFDNELLTDLTAFALGFAVFLANSPRNWDSQNSRWPGTSLSRPEYMTPPMFGYALAHLAWFEGERHPAWVAYLGPASKADFAQGVRFLFETNDTQFRPRPLAANSLVSHPSRGGA